MTAWTIVAPDGQRFEGLEMPAALALYAEKSGELRLIAFNGDDLLMAWGSSTAERTQPTRKDRDKERGKVDRDR